MSRAEDLAEELISVFRQGSDTFSESDKRFAATFLASQLYELLYPPFDEHELREFLEKTWKNGKHKGKRYYELDDSFFDYIATESSGTLHDLRRYFMTPETERAAAIKFCRRYPAASHFTPTASPPASAPAGRRTAGQYGGRPYTSGPSPVSTPTPLPLQPVDPFDQRSACTKPPAVTTTAGPSLAMGSRPPRVPTGGVVGPSTTKDPDQWKMADGRKPESAADMLDLHDQERMPVAYDPAQPVRDIPEEQVIREFEESVDEVEGPETGPQIDELSIPF